MKPYIRRSIALGAVMALVVSGGCKVGSDYHAPQATVNSSYLGVDEAKGVRQQVGADVSSWWSQVQDPVLTQLTREAVSGNLTLREALYRIQAARAVLGSTQANLYPQFAEDGGYTHGRSGGGSYSNFDLSTSMGWELDFFGRLARSVEAANADMEMLRELYRNSYVILCADVAQAYVNARSYQEQIRISNENIEIQRHTFDIAQTKNEAGATSKIDENQALGVCRGTESSVLVLQTQYQATLNQLSILVGRTPGYVDELMAAQSEIPDPPEEILVGIPADLLRRRPDIRAAEQKIIAQNARVGVAIGDLYPIFTLSGTFGLDSTSVSGMFDDDSISAAVGPAFRWNILNFGKYRFNVEAQRFTQEEYIAAYREAVLEAAKEVDDAIGSYVNERDRLDTLAEAVDAYTVAYELSDERYKSGQIDFQRLLDSQAGKLSYELQYVQCRTSMMTSVIQLYRALGGDWVGGTTYSAPTTVETVPAEEDEEVIEQTTSMNSDANPNVLVMTVDTNASRASASDARAERRSAATTAWNSRKERNRARVDEILRSEAEQVGFEELESSPSPDLISKW